MIFPSFYKKLMIGCSVIRLVFFVLACIATSRRNKDLQVEHIMEILRGQGIDTNTGNSNSKLIARNMLSNRFYPLQLNRQQVPLQELHGNTAPPPELPNDSSYISEVVGDRPLPAEMATGLR